MATIGNMTHRIGLVMSKLKLKAPCICPLNRKSRRMASLAASFKFEDLQIQLTRESLPKPDPDELVFGRHFSDHMFECEWTADSGWGTPKIVPIHNFDIHPAAKVFHYAVELFEGMKAYRGEDNQVRLFRPELNMARMNSSAKRSSLPTFDGSELIKCIKKLVSTDKEWVPYSITSTLYIRPTLIGVEPCLGVSQSKNSLLYVIAGPVGPYYPTGFKPVSLLADPQYVRSWTGGVGSYKMGSNYAPTIYIQNEAVSKYGCQQVLWLYGEDEMVTEVGTMNMFMHWISERGEEELVTPPLSSGLILPGVTRQSLIELAQKWGTMKVVERNFTMKDIINGLKENRVKEIFGAGTACVVSPVEKIHYKGEILHVPTMDEGAPTTMKLFQQITDIQYGRVSSDWTEIVE